MSKVVRMKVSMAGAFESYSPGDLVSVSDEAAAAWIEGDIAELHQDVPLKVKEMEDPGETGDLKHLGGGYYELPNGEKVKGKENAQVALAELKAKEALEAGEADGPETGNSTDSGASDDRGSETLS